MIVSKTLSEERSCQNQTLQIIGFPLTMPMVYLSINQTLDSLVIISHYTTEGWANL